MLDTVEGISGITSGNIMNPLWTPLRIDHFRVENYTITYSWHRYNNDIRLKFYGTLIMNSGLFEECPISLTTEKSLELINQIVERDLAVFNYPGCQGIYVETSTIITVNDQAFDAFLQQLRGKLASLEIPVKFEKAFPIPHFDDKYLMYSHLQSELQKIMHSAPEFLTKEGKEWANKSNYNKWLMVRSESTEVTKSIAEPSSVPVAEKCEPVDENKIGIVLENQFPHTELYDKSFRSIPGFHYHSMPSYGEVLNIFRVLKKRNVDLAKKSLITYKKEFEANKDEYLFWRVACDLAFSQSKFSDVAKAICCHQVKIDKLCNEYTVKEIEFLASMDLIFLKCLKRQ